MHGNPLFGGITSKTFLPMLSIIDYNTSHIYEYEWNNPVYQRVDFWFLDSYCSDNKGKITIEMYLKNYSRCTLS